MNGEDGGELPSVDHVTSWNEGAVVKTLDVRFMKIVKNFSEFLSLIFSQLFISSYFPHFQIMFLFFIKFIPPFANLFTHTLLFTLPLVFFIT